MAMEIANKGCSKKKPVAKPPTIEDLQKASEHLHYEFWMMQQLPRMYAMADQELSRTQEPHADVRIRANAFLESFLIHARVLMDFMYPDNPRPDDVLAEEFFDVPDEWTSIRKPFDKLSDELQKVKGRVGKEVAHLTYARNEITFEMKQWEFGIIARELSALFDNFLQHVPKNKLSSVWAQAAGESPAGGEKAK